MIVFVICFAVLVLALVCINNAPTKKDMEDYSESIMRETMHELQDYDNYLS